MKLIIVKIFFIVLLFLLLKIEVVGQILESAVIVVDSFPEEQIDKYFYKCDNYSDTTYTGTDTIIAFYKNEKITIFIDYIKGKKIHALGYWDNKNKYQETFFNGSKRNGWDIKWFKNGQKKSQIYYENGVFFSPVIDWYEDGKIKSIINFKTKGSKEFVKAWYKNGNLEDDSYNPNDSSDARIDKEYYDNGQLKSESIYNAGKQKYNLYYSNGKKVCEGNIYNALWGQLGKWQEWYDTGTKKREYFFNDSIPNIKEGKWKWWDKNGKLIKEETYKNNELIDKKEYLQKINLNK
jgi:antitoxin component YwqK of YwqJK toxin-antitoxin module